MYKISSCRQILRRNREGEVVNVIKLYLNDRFGVKPKAVGKDGFSLPVSREINFDSAYDCLARLFSEIGCYAQELTASDGFGSDEFVNLIVKRGNHAFRLKLTSDGACVLFEVT